MSLAPGVRGNEEPFPPSHHVNIAVETTSEPVPASDISLDSSFERHCSLRPTAPEKNECQSDRKPFEGVQ